MRLFSIGQTYIRPLRFGCSGGESKASHGRSLSTPRGEHLSPRGRATEALQLAGMSFYRNFGRRNRTRSRKLGWKPPRHLHCTKDIAWYGLADQWVRTFFSLFQPLKDTKQQYKDSFLHKRFLCRLRITARRAYVHTLLTLPT